ncbi:hypothetical protein ACRAKI_12270 [Saccharothrix isguenensis]
MRLFGRRDPKTGHIGRFRSPHPADVVLAVAYSGVEDQLSRAAPVVSGPGVMESIFITRYEAGGLTVAAGNTTGIYFAFAVDLTATGSGTEGHAYFDRPSSDVRRWIGNAIQLHFGLRTALEGSGAKVLDWTSDF